MMPEFQGPTDVWHDKGTIIGGRFISNPHTEQSWPATGKIPETGTERTGIFRFRSGIDESSDRSIPFRCQVLTVPFSVPV